MTALITDPGFDLNRTEEYKLSIQVSLDGFSFSATEIKLKKLLALEYCHLKLSSEKFLGRRFSEWITNNEILQMKYGEISLIYSPEKFTFIPAPFYDPNFASGAASLAIGNQEDSKFIDNFLPNADGYLVFPASSHVLETLKTRFPDIPLHHPITNLDTELHKLSSLKNISLVIYFRQKSFSILLYDDSKLLLANNFDYRDPEDVLYFILSAMKSLKEFPQNATLYLAGDVIPKGKLHTHLKKHFNRTIFFTPDIHFNAGIFKEPLHRYIVLF